jgi:hypothetical protein
MTLEEWGDIAFVLSHVLPPVILIVLSAIVFGGLL